MGVIEFLKQLDFALETCLKLFFLEQVIGEYLDRYVPLVLQVNPAVHDRHPTCRYLLEDMVVLKSLTC